MCTMDTSMTLAFKSSVYYNEQHSFIWHFSSTIWQQTKQLHVALKLYCLFLLDSTLGYNLIFIWFYMGIGTIMSVLFFMLWFDMVWINKFTKSQCRFKQYLVQGWVAKKSGYLSPFEVRVLCQGPSLKFMFSMKATKNYKIFTIDLTLTKRT